jgi:hypothetical protein
MTAQRDDDPPDDIRDSVRPRPHGRTVEIPWNEIAAAQRQMGEQVTRELESLAGAAALLAQAEADQAAGRLHAQPVPDVPIIDQFTVLWTETARGVLATLPEAVQHELQDQLGMLAPALPHLSVPLVGAWAGCRQAASTACRIVLSIAETEPKKLVVLCLYPDDKVLGSTDLVQ